MIILEQSVTKIRMHHSCSQSHKLIIFFFFPQATNYHTFFFLFHEVVFLGSLILVRKPAHIQMVREETQAFSMYHELFLTFVSYISVNMWKPYYFFTPWSFLSYVSHSFFPFHLSLFNRLFSSEYLLKVGVI